MSGGHKFAGESDLVISPSLQRVVPFCIECKHHKTLRTSHLFHPTELLKSFHAQVLKACERDPFERRPLLVLRGGDMETYAALPSAALLDWFAEETNFDPADHPDAHVRVQKRDLDRAALVAVSRSCPLPQQSPSCRPNGLRQI